VHEIIVLVHPVTAGAEHVADDGMLGRDARQRVEVDLMRIGRDPAAGEHHGRRRIIDRMRHRRPRRRGPCGNNRRRQDRGAENNGTDQESHE
jgi:hypothetical protein